MVRGRKVRAVIPCPENDDCYSPNPKRKGQKQEKTQTITRFFQTVVQMDYNEGMIDEKTEKFEIINEECILEETEILGLNSTPPNRYDLKLSTPHRIEYRMETDRIKTNDSLLNEKQQEQVVPTVEKTLKGKRKPKATEISDRNTKLTEFFPVRRSIRKTKKTVLEEKQKSLEDAVRNRSEDGLLVKIFNGKGRGVVTTKIFEKGDFVVEYSGDLIDLTEANRREQRYSLDHTAGCYMYYFKYRNQQYCIDATAETGRFGRLVNHSRNGNLITRTILLDNKPRLVLIAKDRILVGEEITYDYGDRSKESLKHHPWLAF